MLKRDISLEGLAAWVPQLRLRWIIVVVSPTGPTAMRIRGVNKKLMERKF